MKRYCLLIVTGLTLLCAAQACEKSNTSIGGGETNWLTKCNSDLDCGEGVSCECGICTKKCESSDACSDVPAAAGCLVTEALDDGTCRVALAQESDQGICVARCETDSDCNEDSDFTCINGVCTVIIEEKQSEAGNTGTTYGLVFPFTDAGSSVPFGLNESVEIDGSGYDSGIEPDRSDSAMVGPSVIDSTYLGPAMEGVFPQCPCTADIEQGLRAPTYEAYRGNAYGYPEADTNVFLSEDPCAGDHYATWGGDVGDDNEHSADFRFQGLSDLCFYFQWCTHDCRSDGECPSVDSGTAIPRCSTDRYEKTCYLDCDFQRICPDGMTCIHGVDGSACFWLQDTVKPGCPAYCEQDPMPRDCPNFCASLFVACDLDKGIDCCEGLVCSEEGYCVQE